MKVFVSWSGELSRQVALILKSWFANVIQVVELYVSSEDIDKGTRWFAEISNELETAQFGIVCLTRENNTAPWVLFESGALAKSIDRARITPLLIDLSPADIKGPLVQFQATTITETDILKLVKTVNSTLGDSKLRDSQIEAAFNKWWPDLDRDLNIVLKQSDSSKVTTVKRSERELLEEILQLTRALARATSSQRDEIDSPRQGSHLIEELKSYLEDKGQPLLAVAIDGAGYATLNERTLRLGYAAAAKHLSEILLKPESFQILRNVVFEMLGREVEIEIKYNLFKPPRKS